MREANELLYNTNLHSTLISFLLTLFLPAALETSIVIAAAAAVTSNGNGLFVTSRKSDFSF